MSDLKVSSLVNYPEKYFIDIKRILKELHSVSQEYTTADELYDVDGLEILKRRATSQLELLASHYSKTKRFKTMGDYLEETRKWIKSDAIQRIVDEDKISINQAEKVVYSSTFYKERVDLMEALKSWFIKVEVMYNVYQDMLKSIIQSISLCKKDPNYKLNEHI